MTLQVHDELVFEVPEYEVDTMRTLVRDQMEQVHPLTVPLLVESAPEKTGAIWIKCRRERPSLVRDRQDGAVVRSLLERRRSDPSRSSGAGYAFSEYANLDCAQDTAELRPAWTGRSTPSLHGRWRSCTSGTLGQERHRPCRDGGKLRPVHAGRSSAVSLAQSRLAYSEEAYPAPLDLDASLRLRSSKSEPPRRPCRSRTSDDARACI